MDRITEENPLYRGNETAAGGWLVQKVTDRSMPMGERLAHHIVHSPDGFSWGYGGSGPAELSRCLLIDALGIRRPHPRLYQEFKDAFVARWGPEWEIDAATIRRWVVGFMEGVPPQFSDELRARGFVETLY